MVWFEAMTKIVTLAIDFFLSVLYCIFFLIFVLYDIYFSFIWHALLHSNFNELYYSSNKLQWNIKYILHI